MKNICLLFACLLMIMGLSFPAFAADSDPFSGDSPSDIWQEGLPSMAPDPSEAPVVSAAPAPVASEKLPDSEVLTDEKTSNAVGEVSSADDPAADDPVVSDSTGTVDVPVIAYHSSQLSVRDMLPYSSDYSASLMGAIFAVFGEYTPRTYSVTTYLEDGTAVTSTEIVPGLAGLDYNWIAGVALFTISLFCIFRLIGGLFRWS